MQSTRRSLRLSHVLATVVAATALIVPMGLQSAQGVEPEELEVTLVSTHTAESGYEAARMLDGQSGTHFHSPWNGTETFPYAIDLSVGDEAKTLDRLVMTPRPNQTGDGATNGRPGGYEVLVGDSLDALTSVSEGTWANTPDAKTVSLAGRQGRFVRLVLSSTYGHPGSTGNPVPSIDKFVVINNLEVFGADVVAPEPTPEPQPIYPIGGTDTTDEYFAFGDHAKIKMTSVTPAKDVYEVGDVLALSYRYYTFTETMPGNTARSVVMSSDTVTGTCSESYAGPNRLAGNCGAARYTITAADAAAGVATITTEWTVTGPGVSEVITHASQVAVADAVEPTPTPTEDPEPAEPRPEGVYVALASAGDWNFSCHRIPALTQAPNGDILAAWDGRPGCGDSPNPNSILQSISTDGGQTWSDAVNIAAGQQTAPRHGYSDPSYVTDLVEGKVFAHFLKSYDQGFWGSQPGVDPDDRQVQHSAVIESSDNGRTWSEPRIITADITTDVATWKSRFASSGEGIQLRYGAAAGRLIVMYPMQLVNGTIQSYSVYSDDHGDTWQAGIPAGVAMDENKVVELSDGTLMMNTRDNAGRGYRRIAFSEDQGITWGDVTTEQQLPDPRNNASIIRVFPDAPLGSDEAKILAFSNANSQTGRVNGTVRISYDDGETWSAARVFEPGAMSYSTLTPLKNEEGEYDGTMGLLFEGANNQIRYMTISLDWVDPLRVAVTPEVSTLNRGANEVSFTIGNHGEAPITVTPRVSGPSYLDFGTAEPVTIPVGGTVEVTVDVTVPQSVDPGTVTLNFDAALGDEAATAAAAFRVVLRPGENPSAPVAGIAPVGTVPGQSGETIANAFDGNPATIWHTPYGTGIPDVTLPLDVDIEIADEPLDAAWLQYVPRQVGSNGSIEDYEIWAGNDLAELTKVSEGSWPSNNATKSASIDGEYRFVRLRVLSTHGGNGNQWVSAAEFRVTQVVADSETDEIPLELVSEHAAQATFPASNMFDGNIQTWFHSPWTGTETFPYAIDLALGDEPVDLSRFVMTPKQGGVGDGANNGRPGPYRILAGDSLEALEVVASGTWADTEDAKSVPLSGTARFVRLELGPTYGSPAARFVAIGELQVFGVVVPEADDMLTIVLERTDANGSPVEVGDRLTFNVTYTNNSDRTLAAFPRTSNMTGGFQPPTAPNCRYSALTAGQSHTCVTAFHVVTQADLAAGSYTPSVTFDATADAAGNQVLEVGSPVTLPAIPVSDGTVEPTATPTSTPTATATPTASPTPTVTVTSTATATATATTTATATATTTATATSTATVTSTATATATASVTATSTATQTVTGEPTATVTATATATGRPSTSPTVTATSRPTQGPSDVYTTPGRHEVNGREWFTTCEPYSQTFRCRTDIWASTVQLVDGRPTWVTGWAFNNLTYLPSDRGLWVDNPLGHETAWTAADGRRWYTECDTAATGRNGCRSYIWMSVWEPTAPAATTFRQTDKWVFNNIVHFS